MTLQELKKKRGFTVEQTSSEDYRLQFKHSNINVAREALQLFKELGANMAWNDVNGSKAVGGYYASGTITKEQARELGLIQEAYNEQSGTVTIKSL